jgi:O-antigen ligase
MITQLPSTSLKKWLLLISVFCFSFNLLLSIACWILIGLLSFILKEHRLLMFEQLKREKYLWLLPAFYLMHLLGVLWTSNYSQAGLDLQIKLTLLLLPIILSSFQIDAIFINKIRRYFIGGVLVSCIYLLIIAFARYFKNGELSVFFYSEFSSSIMHPTYFSLYLNAALLFVLHEMILSIHRRTIWMGAAFMIVFFSMIILLAARTAEATALISVLVMIVLYWKKKGSYRFIYPLLFVFVMSTSLQILILKYSNRFAQVEVAVKNTIVSTNKSFNSTTGRIEIWRETISLLPDYWLLGTGTGDVKDVLNQEYQENDFAYGYEKSLNAHNQYLQSFLAIGIIGLLLFLLTIITPWLMRNSYHPLLLMLLFIFALNCLTESMLEAQRGTIFFALMISIFGRKTHSNSKLSH